MAFVRVLTYIRDNRTRIVGFTQQDSELADDCVALLMEDPHVKQIKLLRCDLKDHVQAREFVAHLRRSLSSDLL